MIIHECNNNCYTPRLHHIVGDNLWGVISVGAINEGTQSKGGI